jgi:hypothetical protein
MNFSEIAELGDIKRSFQFWDGCRVVAFDEKDNLYKYGVVWNYDEASPYINLVLDGEIVKTARVFRNACYKIEDWKERKPVASLGKIDARALQSAENAPAPPQYFTRRIPIHSDLTFARAAWIWAEAHVFQHHAGKRMDMPKFIYTKSGNAGMWYIKERTMGVGKAHNLTYVKYFATIVHEMCHQYNTVVQKLRGEGHGPNFNAMIDYCNTKCGGVEIPRLIADENQDLVKPEENEKMKDARGVDHDLLTPSTLKFWVIVLQQEGKDNRLYAVRISNDMKGLELTTKLNSAGYVAAMYTARFKALEVFASASAFNTKFYNSLRPINGAHISLIAEHGEMTSETTIDVVKRFIKYNPNYKDTVTN